MKKDSQKEGDKFLFAKADYDLLCARIEELVKMLEESNKDAFLSTEESSETWHDNYRFEEGIRQSFMLSNQIEEMKKIKFNAKLIDSPDPKTLMGHRIIFLRKGEKREIILGSHSTFSQDPKIVSYNAPLASALRNGGIGIEFGFGPANDPIQILSIEAYPDYFKM